MIPRAAHEGTFSCAADGSETNIYMQQMQYCLTLTSHFRATVRQHNVVMAVLLAGFFIFIAVLGTCPSFF